MKFRTAIPNGKSLIHWVKEWITCMIVFALAQLAFYKGGFYQNVDHDATFWAITTLATCAVGSATPMYLKKNSACGKKMASVAALTAPNWLQS
jgi:hypothetical protein